MCSGVGASSYNLRELAVILHLTKDTNRIGSTGLLYGDKTRYNPENFNRVLAEALNGRPLYDRKYYIDAIKACPQRRSWGYFLALRYISGRKPTKYSKWVTSNT